MNPIINIADCKLLMHRTTCKEIEKDSAYRCIAPDLKGNTEIPIRECAECAEYFNFLCRTNVGTLKLLATHLRI